MIGALLLTTVAVLAVLAWRGGGLLSALRAMALVPFVLAFASTAIGGAVAFVTGIDAGAFVPPILFTACIAILMCVIRQIRAL